MVTQLFLISFAVTVLGFAGVYYFDGWINQVASVPAALGLLSSIVLAFNAAKSGG